MSTAAWILIIYAAGVGILWGVMWALDKDPAYFYASALWPFMPIVGLAYLVGILVKKFTR